MLIYGLYILPSFLYLYDEKSEEKVWLHRANSLNKAIELIDDYPNFELDVIYKDENFHIAHDEHAINEENLKNYLFYLSGNDRRIWLDIKNVTADNAGELFDNLDKLLDLYNIDDERVIIESRNWRAFELIADTDFKKSFYVDIDPDAEIEKKMDMVKEIDLAYKSGYINTISFWGENYRFLSENIKHDIAFLTWEHRLYEWQLPVFRYVRDILSDNRVEVILCKKKGKYHL